MGPGRFALPLALAGVAGGVLAADVVPAVPWLAALAMAGMLGLAGLALGPSSRAGTTLLLAATFVGFVAIGAWRQAAPNPGQGDAPGVAILVDGAEHEVVGTIIDDPRPRAERVQIVLGNLVAAVDGLPVRLDDQLLVWMPRGIDAGSGDRLRIHGDIELAEDFDGFAYREYLERQGIGAIGRPRSAEIVSRASGPIALLAGARGSLLAGLNSITPEPEAALGAGILLGVRASIAPEINDAFATAGLTHVVAISGWNIAIVAALVAAMARPLERVRGGRWTGAAVATATVAGYVVLTGASPSVVRAALMAGALLVARLGGSRAHAASALALAALLMLLAAPSVLWDVGFQLSLLATAGLIWFGAPVERRLSGWPSWIREPVALTLAAQLTTLPVILVNFERLSLVAPIANVLVVPFVPLAMLFSAAAAFAGLVDSVVHVPVLGDAATWLAGGAAWLVLRVIIFLGTTVASVPYAAVDVSLPAPVAIAWLPVLGLASWALHSPPDARRAEEAPADTAQASAAADMLRRVVRPLPGLAVLVAILAMVTFASRPDGRLHLTVLDIGQGDAILVETPSGATMLVDGGPDPELTLRRIGANLPFHVRRIDVMVLTHPHQDHVAGLVEVHERFRVGSVIHAGIDFENPAANRFLTDAADEPAGSLEVGRAGQVLRLDAATSVEVLYPGEADAAAPLPEGDINNGSLVLLIRHGGFTALLTGDAEAPVESELVARGDLPVVDVLKVGHHGSRSSTTLGLVEAVAPAVALISAGVENDYGHPAPETLDTLARAPNIAVLRTDLHGDLEVITDGRSFWISTRLGSTDVRAVHRQASGRDRWDDTAVTGDSDTDIALP